MRIDAYTQVQQIYKTNKTNKLKSGTAYSTNEPSTQVDISDFGKSIQVAKKAVADTPDVRTDLVDSIKSRIQEGTYEVDVESFAEKLFLNFQEQNSIFKG